MTTIEELILEHTNYSRQCISLIASENYHDADCPMQSISANPYLSDKYAEGFAGARYYSGCHYIDKIEKWCEEQACKVFNVKHANLQPWSGSQANQCVYAALLKPGDKILSLSLDKGGHLSHGHKVSIIGSLYKIINYGLNAEGDNINYEEIRSLALLHKPRLIIAGFSCYSYIIDWQRIASIAREADTYFLADIAHISGLVAGGVYPTPVHCADVVTTTTQKTLGGPRGGMIMTNHDRINTLTRRGTFPGVQGGPHLALLAAKGWALHKAQSPEFVSLMKSIVTNAQTMENTLKAGGIKTVWGNTQTHIVLIDLRPHNINGRDTEIALEKCGIWTNRNQIPNDPLGPLTTSGIRLGTAALTFMGGGEDEAVFLALCIVRVINALRDDKNVDSIIEDIKPQVASLALRLKS